MKYIYWILYFLIAVLLSIITYPLSAHSGAPPFGTHEIQETTKSRIETDLMTYCPIGWRGVAMVIIQAESQLNPLAVGDNGTSFGLVQIHLPAHLDVSVAQAEDIDFSIKFLCNNLVQGNGKIWSTYPITSG